jgi:hypothetical protein
MKDRKIHDYICVAICVVTVAVVLCIKYVPRAVPWEECSEVYKRYSRVEGVRATYVKDFRVNDTLTVGVTLLEATTDSGWAALQRDFGLPVIPKEYEERLCGDSNRVSHKFVSKSVPLVSDGDTLSNDLITISYYKQTICHFVIMSKEQKKAILYKQFDDNIFIKRT